MTKGKDHLSKIASQHCKHDHTVLSSLIQHRKWYPS